MRLVLAFVALALHASAAQYTLELTPANTQIQWTLGDVLHTVRGTFNLKRGRIDFDTATGAASGEVLVDVTSGNSGSDARDRKMQSNVLESKKYPEAIFTPDAVEGSLSVPGASTLKIKGTFAIHGATHRITMDVQATATADRVRAKLAFDIPYVEWGMKDPSNFLLKVNKTVQMSIETEGPLRSR